MFLKSLGAIDCITEACQAINRGKSPKRGKTVHKNSMNLQDFFIRILTFLETDFNPFLISYAD